MANPCIQAIKKAAGEQTITDKQAADILKDMAKFASQRKQLKGLASDAEALRDVAGELDARNATIFARDRRNLLLDTRKNRDRTADVVTGKKPGDIMRYKFLGTESKDGAGFAGGTFINISNRAGLWSSRLNLALKAMGEDVADFFYNSTSPLDFLKEWKALSAGEPSGSTGNKLAVKAAKVAHELNGGINAELAAQGATIVERGDFMGTQTHARERLHALGRKPGVLGFFQKADKAKAFSEWIAYELPLWDLDKLTDGGLGDPIEIGKHIFDNLWEGKHQYGPDAGAPKGPALTNRFARERVIPYKDAESYHAHEVKHGRFAGNYAMSVMKMFENKGRTLALLEDWGPGGKANVKKTIELAREHFKSLPDSPEKEAGLGQLTDGFARQMDSMYDMVSGLIEVPDNAVIAMVGQAAHSLALTTTGGAMMLNSFGDFPVSINQMTYAGASTLDAFGTRIQWLFRNKKVSAEALHQLGIGSAAYLLETQRGFRDLTMADKLRSVNQKFYDVIGMTRLTESTRAAAGIQLATDFGRDAGKAFDELSPDMQRVMEMHGITPADWNVFRKAAKKIEGGPLDGYTVLTHENFYTLPDADIAELVRLDGSDPSNVGNIRRKVNSLERKFGGMMNERIAAAASEPGGMEQWMRTGGTQTGTWGGESRRALFMYKSFLLSVTRRQAGQFGQLSAGRFASRSAMTLAGVAIAGYVSLTVNNLLRGKEPPKLIDEDGTLNVDTLKKSIEKGGFFGLYGSVLMNDHDRFMGGVADSLAGPVFGKAFDAVEGLRGLVPSEDESSKGFNFRNVERNIPFANVFYIKPVLDHAIFWNIREMLQPGSLHRSERSAEGRGEEWFVRPSQIAPLPFAERMEELGKMPQKVVE